MCFINEAKISAPKINPPRTPVLCAAEGGFSVGHVTVLFSERGLAEIFVVEMEVSHSAPSNMVATDHAWHLTTGNVAAKTVELGILL